MRVTLELATPDDAPEVAALRCAAADDLTRRCGHGHWSTQSSERGVLRDINTAKLFVARNRSRVIATLLLTTKKPWAIDTSYFTPCARPLYLMSMAVDPASQRRGIGRTCLEHATRIARDWPADAIRLDAYDTEAGAGEFYEKCGYREVGRVSYRGTPLVYLEIVLS